MVQVDISDAEKEGSLLTLHNVEGRHAQYLATKRGKIFEVTKDGMVDISAIRRHTTSPLYETSILDGVQPNQDPCGLICGLQGVVFCDIIDILTGGAGTLVCSVVLVVVCWYGCG